MGLLRRRKRREDEDDEEDDIEEEKVKKPSKKKFKDLDSENSRRRKTPPKPWGKKERFVVLIFFAGMALTAAILAASSRNWKLPGLPKLGLPKINISDTIIIEKPTARPRATRNYEPLKKEIQDLTYGLSGIYGVYVWDFESQTGFGVNENEAMQAASLIKLPVMSYIYKQAEEKKLSLSQIVPVGEERYTYRQLVERMGHQSDNNSFNAAVESLGAGNLENYIQSLGMVNTSIATNDTTPLEIAKFFKDLWNGDLVGGDSRDEIMESLTDTIWEDWIPAAINDENINIAHKYGRETNVINDAGIVLSKNPYVLVIMSDGIEDAKATEVLPQIIQKIHSFMANN